jgi:hypothetical protein
MEEVVLAVIGSDEPEAAIGDELLDSPAGHLNLRFLFSNWASAVAWPFERNLRPRVGRPTIGRSPILPRSATNRPQQA